jgi:hypothetical protein
MQRPFVVTFTWTVRSYVLGVSCQTPARVYVRAHLELIDSSVARGSAADGGGVYHAGGCNGTESLHMDSSRVKNNTPDDIARGGFQP